MRRTSVVALCVLGLVICGVVRAQEPDPNRDVGPSGKSRTKFVVSTGQYVQPAGRVLQYNGRPVDVALSPDSKSLYVKDSTQLAVVDVQSWSMRQTLPLPELNKSSMHGLAISRDGKTVWYTAQVPGLLEANVKPDGTAAWGRSLKIPGGGKNDSSYACGIALSADETKAYLCLSVNNSLAEVDLNRMKLLDEIEVGVAPFGVVLSRDGQTAYVSNWGGRRVKPGERSEKSAGTDVLIDARGVPTSGTVGVVDLASHKQIAELEVGLHPSDMVLSEDGKTLYVANANSDTVSVIDTQARRVATTIHVKPDPSLPFGSAPNALALSDDGATLFVANGGNNAIAVVRLSDGKIRGLIPAGWYPGALAMRSNTLYSANVKGIGSRPPKSEGKWNSHGKRGTIVSVEVPSPEKLTEMTRQANADALVPQALRAWEGRQDGVAPVPVPARIGEPSVFEHVVYVIKENRTYDQVFGDIGRGNSDPKLCTFGRNVTPNQHALAEQFVLLDNYYCNGVVSADGHAWATEGYAVDYLEKAQGSWARSYPFGGDDPLAVASTGFIWDEVLARGLSFRNYGEMCDGDSKPGGKWIDIYKDFIARAGRYTFSNNIAVDRLREYSHPGYPGWNMQIADVIRAEIFLKEFREFEQKGFFPSFTIIYLPQDHTAGTLPGAPTPAAHVADNDLAVGRIIEAISHSKFWPTTSVFINEDDPQNGYDHVDGHRSTCLVISPYTKRGAVISEFYNQTSVLHTMELMLGLPPMNQFDAMSPPMRACFSGKPDFKPFTALPANIPLDQLNPEKAAMSDESKTLDLTGPDRINEDALNRILWHAAKGMDAPYPAEFAGAHGKGLPALHLKLDQTQKDDND